MNVYKIVPDSGATFASCFKGFGLGQRNNLVLAKRKVDEKSNAITAILKLLAALELSGTEVTINAMGCRRSVAEKIIVSYSRSKNMNHL
jgi:hypothetical protein